LDQNTHVAKDFTNYTIFSLWDTYRALHPLFNLIQTKRNSDMVESMLAHYDQSVHLCYQFGLIMLMRTGV